MDVSPRCTSVLQVFFMQVRECINGSSDKREKKKILSTLSSTSHGISYTYGAIGLNRDKMTSLSVLSSRRELLASSKIAIPPQMV